MAQCSKHAPKHPDDGCRWWVRFSDPAQHGPTRTVLKLEVVYGCLSGVNSGDSRGNDDVFVLQQLQGSNFTLKLANAIQTCVPLENYKPLIE